jgi:hypothetical protein
MALATAYFATIIGPKSTQANQTLSNSILVYTTSNGRVTTNRFVDDQAGVVCYLTIAPIGVTQTCLPVNQTLLK